MVYRAGSQVRGRTRRLRPAHRLEPRYQAATKFDRKEKCGAEANMAKLLASEAAWEAANVCLTTHGGYGFATEYDVERKFRETRLLTVAPVSNNLVLAYLGQHVLGMPKSY
jgi:acyl-CoA dehydrogenase